MADDGLTTGQIPTTELVDELVGNREGSVGRISTEHLAAQLAETGAMAAKFSEHEDQVDQAVTDAEEAVSDAQLIKDYIGGAVFPVGAVAIFPVDSVPSTFLAMEGQAVTSDYPDLRQLLIDGGSVWGTDGSGDPLLPDTRGEFIRGWDNARGVDVDRDLGSSQLDQMQRITGSFVNRTSNTGISAGAFTTSSTGETSRHEGSGAGVQTVSFDSGDSPEARVGDETRPRNVAMIYAIKAFHAYADLTGKLIDPATVEETTQLKLVATAALEGAEMAQGAAELARDATELAAGVVARATSVAGLGDPATFSEGDGGLVSGSGDVGVDGLYEVQSSNWVRIQALDYASAELTQILISVSGALPSWVLSDGSVWIAADGNGRLLTTLAPSVMRDIERGVGLEELRSAFQDQIDDASALEDQVDDISALVTVLPVAMPGWHSADGAALLATDASGRLLARLAPAVLRQIAGRAGTDVLSRVTGAAPGWAAADGSVPLAVDHAGRLLGDLAPALQRRLFRGEIFTSAVAEQVDAYDPEAAGLLPSRDIYMTGDSYMNEYYRLGVKDWFDEREGTGARSVAKASWGGYTTDQILTCMGMLPLTAQTIGGAASGVIPGDGSAVAITLSVNPLYSGGAAVTGHPARVLVGGVDCLLTTDASANLTIARVATGSDVAVAADDVVTLHPTIGTAVLPGTETYRGRTHIFCGDRNNDISTVEARIASRDAVARYYDYQTSREARVLVMGRLLGRAYALDGTTLWQGQGTAAYDAHHAYMDMMRAMFGRAYYDTNEWARTSLIYELGLTPDADDLADMALGCCPRSLFTTGDLVHTNTDARRRQGYHSARLGYSMRF